MKTQRGSYLLLLQRYSTIEFLVGACISYFLFSSFKNYSLTVVTTF